MTQEQLKKAKVIESEIAKLKDHICDIKSLALSKNEWIISIVCIGRDPRYFNSDFLPITLENFLDVYVQNAEKKIAELEKEFSKI